MNYCVLTLLLVINTMCLTEPVWAWSSEEEDVLDQGNAVVDVSPAAGPADGRITGEVNIAAPPSVVWSVLVDCQHAPSFMPNLKSCLLLQADPKGTWDIREHKVHWISLLPEITSVFRSTYVTDKSIQFEKYGGDLEYLKGSWVLEPFNGGQTTKLNYQADVAFNAMVPGGLVRRSMKADIPEFLERIRDRAVNQYARHGG